MKCLPYRYWTNHEIKALKDLYQTTGATKLATTLNRSVDAVRQAARKYGLTADKDLYKPPPNRYMKRKSDGK